jgi:Zn-dependent M16 (insulinase) family peptidase
LIVWTLLKELLVDTVAAPLDPELLKVSIGLDIADLKKCNGFVDTVASTKGGDIAALTDDDVATFFTGVGV